MSFSSSTSREYGTSSRRVSFQEARDNATLQKMLCWIISDGTKAMELSLGNDSPLKPRTDLGEQGVRMAEIRQMAAAAYASGKTNRIKYWYTKLYMMKKTMREEVDRHLAQCSKHPKYKRFRNRIDALRKEPTTGESSSSSSSDENEKNESSSSSSDKNSPPKIKNYGKIAAEQISDTDSDSDAPETVKKRKRVDDTKNKVSKSKASSSSITKRNGVDIEKVELSQSEVNLPFQKLDGIEAVNNESDSVESSPIKKKNWIRVVKIEALQSDDSPPVKKRRIAGEI